MLRSGLALLGEPAPREGGEGAPPASEARFCDLLENIPDVAWTTRFDGTTVYISPNVERVYGFSADEIRSAGSEIWLGRIHPDDVDRVRQAYRELFSSGRKFDVEYRIRHKDGHWIWLHDRALVSHEQSGVAHADGLFVDITARKEIEEALLLKSEELEQQVAERTTELAGANARLNEEMARLEILSKIQRGILAAEQAKQGKTVVIDPAKLGSAGRRVREEHGLATTVCIPCLLRVHRGLPPDAVAQLQRIPPEEGLPGWVVKRGEALVVDDLEGDPRTRIAVPPGLAGYVGLPMRSGGRMVGVLSLTRMQDQPSFASELQLLATVADRVAAVTEGVRLRQLAEQAAVLAERNRLARDLHDSVTQALYSVTLLAESGRRAASANDLSTVEQHLGRLTDVGQQALKEMRLLIHELRPPALERQGLAAALQPRLDAVEGRVGVQARLLVHGEGRVDLPVEHAHYHIALEALNNALKHAKADDVVVELILADGSAELKVSDNGIGFTEEAVAGGGGMGLANMRERAAQLGGELSLDSAPGQGTTVRITVASLAKGS